MGDRLKLKCLLFALATTHITATGQVGQSPTIAASLVPDSEFGLTTFNKIPLDYFESLNKSNQLTQSAYVFKILPLAFTWETRTEPSKPEITLEVQGVENIPEGKIFYVNDSRYANHVLVWLPCNMVDAAKSQCSPGVPVSDLSLAIVDFVKRYPPSMRVWQ